MMNIKNDPTKQIDESLIPTIGKTAKRMGLYITDQLAKYHFDLTKEQFIMLKILHNEDGRAQKELAFVTDRNKGSLARLLSNMEKKDLVQRVISKQDKRINKVYLTEKGKQTFEDIQPILKETIQQLQAGLSEEEMQTVKSIFEKINANLSQKITCNKN